MARPKRIVEEKNYDVLISECEEKIISLNEELKSEKANLKQLKKDKELYEEQKLEEENKLRIEKIADMISKSGMSFDEIENLLSK